MILPFSTQINGKPTNFVSKIWAGIENKFTEFGHKGNRFNPPKEYYSCADKGLISFKRSKPKYHTIREDLKDRWHKDVMIDFYINCRQKNMFQFAPRLPCVSTQKIEIYHRVFAKNLYPEVLIDNVRLNPMKLYDLAQNDGFETIEDFFEYFNKDYQGKIIHWTDLRY